MCAGRVVGAVGLRFRRATTILDFTLVDIHLTVFPTEACATVTPTIFISLLLQKFPFAK